MQIRYTAEEKAFLRSFIPGHFSYEVQRAFEEKFGHRITWDHPRLRGEHTIPLLLNTKPIGSPPPTRGTQLAEGLEKLKSGITPAYAGNTVIRSLKHVMSDYINP